MADIIHDGQVVKGIDAEIRGEGLWLSAADLARISGWEFKPQGFCKGETCVPVPPARANELTGAGRYNLAGLAKMLGQPVIHDKEHNAWSIGEAAGERRRALTSLDAPDFELPDLEGRMHRLSQFRGKKVLLVSWASW